MSYFWETYTDSSTTTTDLDPFDSGVRATNITVENYYLYTRDVQLSRGGMAGINYDPTRQNNSLHPDYYRCGRDDKDDWTQVAAFGKPGFPLIIIQIWVQDYAGFDDELGYMYLKGKPVLIPLNSGPDYLATRPDNEFIMSTPPSSIGSGSANWTAIRSDMFNLYGYTENDLVQPGNNMRAPYTDGALAYEYIRVLTSTGAHAQTGAIGIDSNGYLQASQHSMSFPTTKGHLQSGVPDGRPYDSLKGPLRSPIYTGGEVSIIVKAERLHSDPPLPTTLLGIQNGMSLGAATLIDTINFSTVAVEYWHRSAVFDDPAGTNLRDGGMTIMNIDFDFGLEGIWGDGVPLIDPWVSLGMPPPYTITSTDGHAVKGGYRA